MQSTLETPLPKRDVYYYRQRQKNRVFADLAKFFADEAERTGVRKRDIAGRLGCDPALVTRWLSAPSNMTLDTISDLLLALNAEMDHRIVRFDDRAKPNAAHPLIASIQAQATTSPVFVVTQTAQTSPLQVSTTAVTSGSSVQRLTFAQTAS